MRNSGIEQGDTIIEVNNNEIGNTDELIEEVNNSNGEAISIKYVRNNQTMQTSITPVKSDNEYKIRTMGKRCCSRSPEH